MAKLILRKHQRALVQSFAKYQLDDMLKEEESEKLRQNALEQLASNDAAELFDVGKNVKVPDEMLTEE